MCEETEAQRRTTCPMCPYITCFPSFHCFMELDSQDRGRMDFFSFIEVKLISNVVLMSAVQQSDSVMYTVFTFKKNIYLSQPTLVVVCGIQLPDQGWDLGPLIWSVQEFRNDKIQKFSDYYCKYRIRILIQLYGKRLKPEF